MTEEIKMEKYKKLYQANIKKQLDCALREISLGASSKLAKKYEQELAYFYINLGEYTQKVYLNFEVIKAFAKKKQSKVHEINLKLLIQLPFFLRSMDYANKALANMFIQLMNLEDYAKTIEKLEIQHYHILKDKNLVDAWVESFENISRMLTKMQKKDLIIFKNNKEGMKIM